MTSTHFQIRLPGNTEHLPINEEYFFITQNDQERRLKLHDYSEIYRIPGLYEYINLEILQCLSPEIMSSFLVDKITETGLPVEKLKILEIAAGSGLFGKKLAQLGVTSIVGVDILPEAAIAAKRECPGVYQHYFVENLTQLSESTNNIIKEQKLNCLVCCSALSTGHIPVAAFSAALNLIEEGGWVIFNLAKTSYDNQSNPPEFVRFYHQAIAKGTLKLHDTHVYNHRRFFNGQPLQYVVILARKQG